jgi:hypothetical protein
LVGIGDAINESQMEELDDLESGTDVDIWDHKIAKRTCVLWWKFLRRSSART